MSAIIHLHPFETFDWVSIRRRLQIIAAVLCKSSPGVFDGISPEDLASEVVLEFLASPNTLGWDGERDCVVYLGNRLKFRLLDHIRRHHRGVVASQLENPTTFPDFVRDVESQSTVDAIQDCVEGDQDLERFVEAAVSDEFTGGHNQNQQLAAILDATTADVLNLRRRLLRRMQKHRKILK